MNDESRRCKFKQKIRSSFPLLFTSHAGAELLLIIGKELIFTGDSSGGSRRAYF
jgi:hypothetical protein